MLFNKNVDKETIKILSNENKRLKIENQQLNESLDELQRYKKEYKSLIDELNRLKESYANKMEEFDAIGSMYKNELDRLMKDRKNKR